MKNFNEKHEVIIYSEETPCKSNVECVAYYNIEFLKFTEIVL